jgi:hypothetical protein
MNLQNEIMQAEAFLQLKKIMYKAKRCTKRDVEDAEDKLNALLIDTENIGDISVMVMPLPEIPKIVQRYEGSNYEKLQAELTAEAKRLSDEQAAVSNQIVASYRENPLLPVPELMAQAIALKKDIEKVWDKKYFLERNRYLKDEVDEVEDEKESNEIFEKRIISAGKRKLVKDQIYKLEKKIADPTKHVKFNKVEGKLIEWNKELLILQDDLRKIEIDMATK